jgi:hypothetical protein
MLEQVWCSMPPPHGKCAWAYFSSTKGYSPKAAAKVVSMAGVTA